MCKIVSNPQFLILQQKHIITSYIKKYKYIIMQTAILGGGCFWCIEAMIQRLKGVTKVLPGYCGGQKQNPSYKEVKTGTTGHIEVVQVTFDPKIISYQTLLEVFMHIHDPTQKDGQGEDIGSQYVSAIFCVNKQQRQIAQKVLHREQQQLQKQGKKICTVIKEGYPFYIAQDYHHNYFNEKGSENPYCDIIPPKITKMKHLFKDLVQENT